ncbi:MAG: 30S ribosomal protein S17 [Bryobacter sp.]|jgi:small subunit ribosomal protein S17|nr:30S ribosomal protein S17 [Bryobacter sp. CoA8 C33]
MAEATQAVKQPNKQEKVGEVVSTKMAKTIVVQVTRKVQHPLYKRILTRRNKFYAHDEEGRAKLGDQVRIIESRPLSKLKRWELKDVIRQAVRVQIQDESKADKTAKTAKKSK